MDIGQLYSPEEGDKKTFCSLALRLAAAPHQEPSP